MLDAPARNVGVTEKAFVLHGFRYAAKLWGAADGVPVLALHGWLDNCASFDVLAPHLKNVQLLALDLAGHGFSDHRVGISDYSIWSEIAHLYGIADQMGWDQFSLAGHSRGAMIALLAASVYPERIANLVLIDAVSPPPVLPESAPDRLVKSIQELNRRIHRPTSCYPTYDDAIRARCMSDFGKIDRHSAELLAVRGLRELEQGFNWHADGKLWASSNVGLSREQIDALVARVSAETLLVLGKQGIKNTLVPHSEYCQQIYTIIEQLNARVEEFNDGHFLHMGEVADQVAVVIDQFLLPQHEAPVKLSIHE